MLAAWSLYSIIHYSFDYTELLLPLQHHFANLSVFFVRLCFQFHDHYEKLIWYQSLQRDEAQISQKQGFWQSLHEKLTKSSIFQHCTRSQGLPLNTPSKGIVDQACLINYAGCDESLKCAGCPTLQCPFSFWFTGTTSNGLINPSSHPIHKLFRMEVDEIDSLFLDQ